MLNVFIYNVIASIVLIFNLHYLHFVLNVQKFYQPPPFLILLNLMFSITLSLHYLVHECVKIQRHLVIK